MFAADVEKRIDNLCLRFEALKPYLKFLWAADRNVDPARPAEPKGVGVKQGLRTELEV
jgi:hypothetical protein